MTTEPTKIAVWLAVNECGEYDVSTEGPTEATDNLRDNYGFEVARIIAINVSVDLPVAEVVNVDVTLPPETKAPAQVTVS